MIILCTRGSPKCHNIENWIDYWESNVMLWKRLPEKKSFLYLLISSSIWTCRNLTIEYLLFSPGRCSGKNQNNYSTNKLRHVQINELLRTLISPKSCNIFNFLGFIVNFEGTGCFLFLFSLGISVFVLIIFYREHRHDLNSTSNIFFTLPVFALIKKPYNELIT